MSAKASGYAKELVVCPNGEQLGKGEKLVLMVLADSHQDKGKRFTYPSIETIATEALCDRRSCTRYLASLERKGVIRRLRPANQGRSYTTFYFFPAIDELPKGWQSVTLISHQNRGKTGAEGCQKGDKIDARPMERAREQEQERKQKPHTPQPPSLREGGTLFEGLDDAGSTESCAAHVAIDGVSPGASESDLAAQRDAADLATDSADQGKSADALTPGQLEHLARVSDPTKRAAWERAYRQENRAIRGEAEKPKAAKTLSLGTIENARGWVMRGCGFVDRRRKRGLGAIVELSLRDAVAGGEQLEDVAARMVAKWKRYVENRALMRFAPGPDKFFERGMWRDENAWSWDEQKLELRGAASIGSR